MTRHNLEETIDALLDESRKALTISDLEIEIQMMEDMLERERMSNLDRKVLLDEIEDCRSEIVRRGDVT